jgi:DNA-binding NarL/FixJ family response regulator
MSRPATLHATDAVPATRDHDDIMGCTRFSTPTPGERSVIGAGEGGPYTAITVLVDDDPRVRAALAQTIALEPGLVMVAVAADTAAALVWSERADPDVALVDVFLPDEVASVDLIRHLARRPSCAVVAMSVRGGPRPAALAAGAVSFVEKGGDIDAVLDAVRAAASPHHA